MATLITYKQKETSLLFLNSSWKRGDMCICMDDSLCRPAETDRAVESNYASVKAEKQLEMFSL